MSAGSRLFSRFAKVASRVTGHAAAFAAALSMILVWVIAGPLFHFSDTWQLTINTATTIITFLVVFVIQNTQLRDTEAMHIKIDELLRATKLASNTMLDLENLPEEELAELQKHYAALARRARDLKAKAK